MLVAAILEVAARLQKRSFLPSKLLFCEMAIRSLHGIHKVDIGRC